MATSYDPNDDGPVISYGSSLGPGWHSHRVGTATMRPIGAGMTGGISFPVYANTPIPPPAGCARCAHTLSLIPDLSEREN